MRAVDAAWDHLHKGERCPGSSVSLAGRVVSKREFRKALPLLGFSLPTASRRDIDLLFDEFDANGDGQIKYDELRGRLRNFASERRAKAS